MPQNQQWILALDTTGARLNLALDSGTGQTRSQSLPLGRDLSTDLHTQLQQFVSPLSWEEMAAIAVLTGPGSYTGSRIGVVTARTLAQMLQVPLYGYSTLALAAAISAEPGAIAVSIPAQRHHVYGGVYQVEDARLYPTPLVADRNISILHWEAFLKIYETPLPHCQFEFSEDNSLKLVQRMTAIARQQLNSGQLGDWSRVLPAYGKPS
ncbi:tRNA (adenosine(37)-N6)-threonylcarbamoyltransferase complex dimerization subunit type 1 TsaB [Lyngbya confervoides]|uniref:tRNA (Adenosine(37)-N6)-threonylcarbamoyltransferase complex dimerization subunit type 1 TsaB n=1 Tax=Lyngbya confervoides BDU141951 TaxID=1574623 RepID=A0ABD4T3U8_9CYAN|nr:tRNA (adenosine(37)-N6)-threonylcarbamoyltransferase complex dimerization subunit type 1 TsaB [Lyngbya confervoides]MCM1983285.1 tRNA (adenosine(37)-N6)-threonylcarbamoyltransferase complex dimerization subunit type 1 TsaB [Lyngbya confervoides BDU141951]